MEALSAQGGKRIDGSKVVGSGFAFDGAQNLDLAALPTALGLGDHAAADFDRKVRGNRVVVQFAKFAKSDGGEGDGRGVSGHVLRLCPVPAGGRATRASRCPMRAGARAVSMAQAGCPSRRVFAGRSGRGRAMPARRRGQGRPGAPQTAGMRRGGRALGVATQHTLLRPGLDRAHREQEQRGAGQRQRKSDDEDVDEVEHLRGRERGV